MRRGRCLPYEKVRGDGGRRSGCREPYIAVIFDRGAESSSDSGGSGRVSGRKTYSEKNVFVAVIEFRSSSRCQEGFTTKLNEYAITGFPKYVTAHRGRVKSEAESCSIVGSLEFFPGQTVDEMVKSEVNGVGERRLCQGRTKKSTEVIYYREVFRGDEGRECSAFKELKLTVMKMDSWEALSQKVTNFDRTLRKRVAELESMAGSPEGQPAAPKTAPKKNESRKREELGSRSESSDVTSSREVSTPRIDTGQKEQIVRAVLSSEQNVCLDTGCLTKQQLEICVVLRFKCCSGQSFSKLNGTLTTWPWLLQKDAHCRERTGVRTSHFDALLFLAE